MRYKVELIKEVWVIADDVDEVVEQIKKWEENGTFKPDEWTEIYVTPEDELGDITIHQADGEVLEIDVIPDKKSFN